MSSRSRSLSVASAVTSSAFCMRSSLSAASASPDSWRCSEPRTCESSSRPGSHASCSSVAGQPHEHRAAGVARLDAVDELAQLGEVEAVERLARALAHEHALGDAADGDHGGRRLILERELDLALRAVAQREAGHLPDGGGEAALGLGAQLQEAGEVACAAPREEYVLLRAQRKRDDRPPHPNRM